MKRETKIQPKNTTNESEHVWQTHLEICILGKRNENNIRTTEQFHTISIFGKLLCSCTDDIHLTPEKHFLYITALKNLCKKELTPGGIEDRERVSTWRCLGYHLHWRQRWLTQEVRQRSIDTTVSVWSFCQSVRIRTTRRQKKMMLGGAGVLLHRRHSRGRVCCIVSENVSVSPVYLFAGNVWHDATRYWLVPTMTSHVGPRLFSSILLRDVTQMKITQFRDYMTDHMTDHMTWSFSGFIWNILGGLKPKSLEKNPPPVSAFWDSRRLLLLCHFWPRCAEEGREGREREREREKRDGEKKSWWVPTDIQGMTVFD